MPEILDDCWQPGSSLLATQVRAAEWPTRMGDQDAADGILHRLIHNAYRFHVRGESQHKPRRMLPIWGTSETSASPTVATLRTLLEMIGTAARIRRDAHLAGPHNAANGRDAGRVCAF